jgi:hypothetical protein
MSLWAGQSTPLIREDDAAELVDHIVESVDSIARRLLG